MIDYPCAKFPDHSREPYKPRKSLVFPFFAVLPEFPATWPDVCSNASFMTVFSRGLELAPVRKEITRQSPCAIGKSIDVDIERSQDTEQEI